MLNNECEISYCMNATETGSSFCILHQPGKFFSEVDVPRHDPVNNPSHYTAGGIETIDYMKAKMTDEQFKGYLIGNIMKYSSRFQRKNGSEDIEKMIWYGNKLLEVMGCED